MSLSKPSAQQRISTFREFVQSADYSFMDTLNADPDAKGDGDDHRARQVYSGHFVPVTGMGMAGPCLCLKGYSGDSVGKCS